MWYGAQVSGRDGDLFLATRDLLGTSSRKLIAIVSAAYLAWAFIATDSLTPSLKVGLLPTTFLVALSGGISLWLLRRSAVLALAIWQLSLVVIVGQALYVSQESAIVFALVLLPLISATYIHWAAGFAAVGAVYGAVSWISASALMPPISPVLGTTIIACGGVAAAVGWGMTHSLLRVTEWSLYSYEEMRRKVDEARQQRLELKQAQEDLILANQELARLSDRLKHMYQVAEDARRVKEEFVANVSHELRTPLNMIIGYSEMIVKSPSVYGSKLPASLLADIAAIQRNSQHLADLVDDVLDLGQIEVGRMALAKEPTSIEALIRAAARVVAPLFQSKGLYLETEFLTDLPMIMCDGTRIRQVLINLLSNAGRFTDTGGVRVSARQQDHDVLVSITDTGPGIPEEERDRLFEPFTQLDASLRRRHGGSGLGLSISRRFIEMHGGHLWLESQVAIGTTFTFSLPAELPVESASIPDSGARRWFSPYAEHEYRIRDRRRRAPAPSTPPRYVVLDEGKALQRLFRRYGEGLDLVFVSNVESAMEELRRLPAEALVANTAQTSASSLLPRLADVPYDTPVITCWVPSSEAAAERLGATHYLIKPVTQELLVDTLSAVGPDVRSVLVADDEPEALQLFARMLSSHENRYQVLQAKSGQMALALLKERRPDILLLDLIMPGMDGFTVFREKAQDPAICDIPVVIVSSRDPMGEAIISNELLVYRGRGFSVPDLMRCIQTVSQVLTLPARPADQARPETHPE
jgi:signal transduction histidine kinase/CheY-like chemotaxis protein